MITPRFKLSQNESQLFVTIYAPFARVADTEIDAEGNMLLFYSSPYYLRLNLPGKLVDTEQDHKAIFDADEGTYKITCTKQTAGEFFPGLDMLTDLLTPKGCNEIGKPLIEVLSEGTENEEEDDENFEYFFEQTIPEEISSEGYKYGFANSHSNVFSSLRDELSCVIDIVNPDSKPVAVRKTERMEKERDSFNEDHYLADLYEQESVLPILSFEPSFYKLQKDNVEYSSTDEETLLKLPRKKLNVPHGSKSYVYFSLVDIIYAWCYDHRITEGENCVESAWNISKLSSTLSWLDTFCSLKEVTCSSVRRALTFPLIRNFEMALLVLQDTIKILSLGKKQVVKCLLEIHSMFNNYDKSYYIFNQLYIADYCVWVQAIKEENLISLADSLKKIKISKDDVNLEITELEEAAEMVIQEEKETKENEEKTKKMKLEARKKKEEEAKKKKIIKKEAEARKKEFKEKEATNTNSVDVEANHLEESMSQMSVIENNFATSSNNNDIEANTPLSIVCDVKGDSLDLDDPNDSSADSTNSSYSTDDSSEDSEDSSDESEDSESDSSSSLDSDDDSDPEPDNEKLANFNKI